MNLVPEDIRERELLKYSIPVEFLKNIGKIEKLKYQVEKPDAAYFYLPKISNYHILKDKTIIPVFDTGESFYVLAETGSNCSIIYFQLEDDNIYRDYGLNWDLLLLEIMIDYFDFAIEDDITSLEFKELGESIGFQKSVELFNLRNLPIEEYNIRFDDDKNWRKEIAKELKIL